MVNIFHLPFPKFHSELMGEQRVELCLVQATIATNTFLFQPGCDGINHHQHRRLSRASFGNDAAITL